jgi:hypothetical protein
MAAPIYNLHNHTPFSVGAYGVDEICQAHLACRKVRVDGVGISDHLFSTPSSREVGDVRDFERLFATETRRYVEHIHEARRRWEGRLDVFCGCEVHWPLNKPYMDAIRSMLVGVDYVLFDNVDWAGLTQLAHQAKRWPCPIGLANTNVARQFPNTSMDQVVRTLANARIFYEISSKLEPLAQHARWFGVLPRHRVLISLGTDTHDDLEDIGQLSRVYEFAVEQGLEEKFFLPRAAERASIVA